MPAEWRGLLEELAPVFARRSTHRLFMLLACELILADRGTVTGMAAAARIGRQWRWTAPSSGGGEADAAEVYRIYRLRDWIEHYYKPAKRELGWADFQVRSEKAIVRHWQLVMLAFTFSLLATAPADQAGETPAGDGGPAADHLAGHVAAGPQLAVPLGAPATA
jgi:hypothetical protein